MSIQTHDLLITKYSLCHCGATLSLKQVQVNFSVISTNDGDDKSTKSQLKFKYENLFL